MSDSFLSYSVQVLSLSTIYVSTVRRFVTHTFRHRAIKEEDVIENATTELNVGFWKGTFEGINSIESRSFCN